MDPEELPIIKIKNVRDIVYSEMDLEMGDSVHDILVDWGKESATEDDYVNIAVREGLQESIEKQEIDKDGTDA